MNSHDANEAAFIQPKLLVALARQVALNCRPSALVGQNELIA
jgi:hypothetical protein